MFTAEKGKYPRALSPVSAMVSTAIIWCFTVLIRVWQICLSPLFGAHCRFAPSCSYYATTALQKHGLWRGALLTAKRVLRCNPWCGCGGVDPVP